MSLANTVVLEERTPSEWKQPGKGVHSGGRGRRLSELQLSLVYSSRTAGLPSKSLPQSSDSRKWLDLAFGDTYQEPHSFLAVGGAGQAFLL